MKRLFAYAGLLVLVASMAVAVTRTRGTSVFDIIEFGQLQPQPYASIASTVDLTLTQWRSASYFPVTTAGGAVDIEMAGTPAASDYGAAKIFQLATGHSSNALTVSADGAGLTTIVTQQGGAGASCEDTGDYIVCWAISGTVGVCTTYCAD
jgi:hypothetical protein